MQVQRASLLKQLNTNIDESNDRRITMVVHTIVKLPAPSWLIYPRDNISILALDQDAGTSLLLMPLHEKKNPEDYRS